MASYEVRRTIKIEAEPADVYEKIVNLQRWESWSPWEGLDPGVAKSYTGPESGVGASYSWKGNRKVGEGNMKITDAQRPGRVALDVQFLKPFKSQSETVLS
ncbi:MAG: SRPBCC family protein, partial [Acidimicrobiia bacterium]|nr:SRPBCC family protein [Acidimicrobiia bacterium]